MGNAGAGLRRNERDAVLVVAAHPDDEALGCGATMARHAVSGDVVDVVFMTDGVAARGARSGRLARRKAAEKAAAILGVRKPHFFDFGDNQMDAVPLLKVVKKLEGLLARLRPRIIYTHHGGDLNVDHQVTCRAALTACRPLPGASVRAIYGFETLSSTEWGVPSQDEVFRPTRYVAAAAQFEKKLAALRCYEMEMRKFPHARSFEAVESLGILRGAQAGLVKAEAFFVLREIEG